VNREVVIGLKRITVNEFGVNDERSGRGQSM